MINLINKEYLEAFGKNLRTAREELNLSQRQLGEKANIDPSQIGRIERGEQNTTLSTIAALAKALGKKPDELLKFPFPDN
ncbi:MAG: helix-turn-helix transcriptional regulator [Cytophagales bacterium]|nr:helix-turn-helix transcriptional regulator [Cytophagales bacterium]